MKKAFAQIRDHFSPRRTEAVLLTLVIAVIFSGFLMAAAASQVLEHQDPLPAMRAALLAPLIVSLALAGIHWVLKWRRSDAEQIILPLVGLLFASGLTMIWRLRGPAGVNQQLGRGFLPGVLVMAALILRPNWIEYIRRWAIPISVIGLALPFLTAIFGVVDETGARLALRIGPLPPIQTTEFIKVALIIFLAWFVEREGQAAVGRGRPILVWLRLPQLRYFIPGALFVVLATLALVMMSDFGAVLILGALFVAMLYAGFETRVFLTISAIGLGLALVMGVALYFTWHIPTVIQYRFLAFLDPWSQAMIVEKGQSTGITIAQGPGYQIQQAIYAVISGGLIGTGLGYGSPGYIPLAASDFIFAAIIEEMGLVVGLALILFFAILIFRILRSALLLPQAQVFERMLLIGIGVHLFVQVFIMVGGTLDLLPLTGVTIPFTSQGGMALLVNLAEVGLVLALVQRAEGAGG
ncbi:MAG TPA: FtsW/RodA/SpoVE family cell cycle protein [Anaerolineales bacterium]